MASFALTIMNVWLLSFVALLLHRLRPYFGAAPLLTLIGGLTVLIHSRYGVYIEPAPGVFMYITSNVFVPVVLMCVLVLYVANGSAPARMTLLSVLGISLFAMLQLFILGVYLGQPGSGSRSGITPEFMFRIADFKVTLASLLAFAADMFAIAVIYQVSKNYTPRVPEWLRIGLALLGSLWTDALLFDLFSSASITEFLTSLPDALLSKTISGLIVWVPLAIYMTRIAPQMVDYVGAENRPVFDMLPNLNDIKQTLQHAEVALQNSENRRREEEMYRRQISEAINEGLWLYSIAEEGVIYVNPAYERLWGQPATDFYRDPTIFVKSIHPEDRAYVDEKLPRQREKNCPYDVEYRIIRPDGVVRRVRDRAFNILNDQGEIYRIVGIAEDITERYENEKHQLDLILEREKVKLLRDFISEASHDLKTPLTAINLKVHSLSRTLDPVVRQRQLNEIQQLSNNMNSLIEDLLTLARLENLTESSIVPIQVNSLVQKLVNDLQILASHKQIQIVMQLAEQESVVEGDLEDLRRALNNIVDNAIRYTGTDGKITIQTRQSAQEVLVVISDTGVGIPPEDQARIFDRFFRASNVRSHIDGTGLGLAIVKRVIDHQQGRIELSSTPGQGTTFTIYLPLALILN
ncbi:MAG: PAS domain-containing protein [Anaerolineae bacterium]|nr:PAS domain-containing protein [Anaerolineae bacterium]